MARLGKALLIASSVVFAMAMAHGPASVATKDGKVQGTLENGEMVYKGVPFAAPPVGPLRWREPQPAAKWSGVLKADKFKPRCMQNGPNYPFGPDEPMSEDCLYLNIWSPAAAPNAKLPVMVWIYGGSFQNGSASDPFYLGDKLAQRGVVVVNINYRLGMLGFFAYPELTQESPHHASGDYGLLDMIAGLQWVKDNIAGFGGDPGNVTVFGQSAGSEALSFLCASPLAKGLFERAIGESGASFAPPNSHYATSLLPDTEAFGVSVAQKLGAKTLADLRALPADKITKASGFWPGIDGYVVPDTLYDIYKAGKENDVPLLLGSTAGEGDNAAHIVSPADYVKAIKQQYGSFAPRILKAYPAHTKDESVKSQRNLDRDVAFGWEMWTWARMQSQTGKSRVFEYYFEHRPAFPDQAPMNTWGTVHGAELWYVMDFLNPAWPWTNRDRELVGIMQGYWVNFAKTGDPNGAGLPKWEPFTDGDQRVMHMDDPFAMGDAANRPHIELIDEFMTKVRTGAIKPAQ